LKKIWLCFLVCLCLALPASGCKTAGQPALQDNKLIVYTSIYPVQFFAQRIGGDKVQVLNIVPSGAQPHSFEPSTRTVAELSRSKLFIYNGAGMEHYLAKLAPVLEEAGVKLVDTSTGIELLSNQEHEHETPEHADSATGHHEHGEFDPHIWLSPKRAMQQGQNIYQALAEIDPANTAYYEDNLHKLQQELEQLDQDFQTTLGKCASRYLVTSHAAFTYLAADYSLQQIPVMGANAEAEPGPATFKDIIQFIKKHNIRYIFQDPLDNPRVSETISSETGASILPLNSLGALSAEEIAAGQDYFTVMYENLANLTKGLGVANE